MPKYLEDLPASWVSHVSRLLDLLAHRETRESPHLTDQGGRKLQDDSMGQALAGAAPETCHSPIYWIKATGSVSWCLGAVVDLSEGPSWPGITCPRARCKTPSRSGFWDTGLQGKVPPYPLPRPRVEARSCPGAGGFIAQPEHWLMALIPPMVILDILVSITGLHKSHSSHRPLSLSLLLSLSSAPPILATPKAEAGARKLTADPKRRQRKQVL